MREWRAGHTVPSIENAERLAEVLGDNSVLTLTRKTRVGRCEYAPCGQSFDRQVNGLKRKFCSARCRGRAYDNPDRLRDARQEAIDEFCKACEPEGLCRVGDCQLRAFSPLPFVPLHEVRGAA